MSAPTNATAARGPGVGGTIACVSCIAPTRPVAITLIFSPLLMAAECTSGLRMRYPTSEKMASPMTKPLKVSASGIRASPTHLIIDPVIRSMPPVCLSASARIEPSTITTAISSMVPPKPCSNAPMKASRSNPGSNPNNTIGTSSAMKTCHLETVISRNRSATTATRPLIAMSALSVIMRGDTACRVGRYCLRGRRRQAKFWAVGILSQSRRYTWLVMFVTLDERVSDCRSRSRGLP